MTITMRFGNESEMLKATVKAMPYKHYGLSCIKILDNAHAYPWEVVKVEIANVYAYSWEVEKVEIAIRESVLDQILTLPIDLLKNHSWLGKEAIVNAKSRGDKVAHELYIQSCNVDHLLMEIRLIYPYYHFLSKDSGSFYNLQQVATIPQLIHVLNVVQCPKEEINNVKFFSIE
jgi:hypothetical protein